jgi:hypothetical protein
MFIQGTELPSIPATNSQPKNPVDLTAWVIAKIQILRPHKLVYFTENYTPQRFIQLNTQARQGRSHSNRLELTRPQNIDAALIFIFGNSQESPCQRCIKGQGIFNGCITLPGYASGACASCSYSSRGKSCELHGKINALWINT